MSGTLKFARAEGLWRASRELSDPAQWPDLEAAEKAILDHPPTTLVDTILILEVLLDQKGDPRSDGRDQAALARVRDFLVAGHRTIQDAVQSGSLTTGH